MDYRTYRLSRKEWFISVLIWSALCLVIAWLFYHSIIAAVLLLPSGALFYRTLQHKKAQQRARELRGQFMVGMQMVCTALRSGYAIENAFREVRGQLEGMYGQEAPIVQEFTQIVTRMGLNYPIEALLMDLGKRSGVEDIRSFAEVFTAARRSGGDLLQIITNTIHAIERKEETAGEIRAVLAGKAMELNIMSLAPLGIMGYIQLTSPDFLAPLYGNWMGRGVMSVCLLIYAAAFLWGRKILRIDL